MGRNHSRAALGQPAAQQPARRRRLSAHVESLEHRRLLSADPVALAAELPTISIDDAVAVEEGDSGSKLVEFVVRLSGPNPDGVTFTATGADGTAVWGEDYNFNDGERTIEPGQTTTSLFAIVFGDAAAETDQQFTVTLSAVSGAAVADGEAVGTILNDDDGPLSPTLSIDDAEVVEGDDGTTQMEFVVRISSRDPADEVNFRIQTATKSGEGFATFEPRPDFDFGGVAGAYSFAAGDTSTQFSVFATVRGDPDVEPDEVFWLELANAEGATIADRRAVGTILNDDTVPAPPPTLTIDDVTRAEGNSFEPDGDGGDVPFRFTVRRSRALGEASVRWATSYGTAVSGDLRAQSGTVTFGPNEVQKQVVVNVEADNFKESDNTFFVNLSQPVNATIADGQGLGTILNDDGVTPPPPPGSSLSINDVRKNEGNTGDTPFTFTVTRSSGTGTASVRYATAYGTAVAGDFPAQSGTVSFAAGQTSRQLTILIEADRFRETDNTFFVNLTQPANAVIGDGQGRGTIVNDD